MLLTLTASTTVVLSTAENIGAAAQTEQVRRTPARTHVLCEEGNSLSSPPGLQEGVHCPAQPSPSTRARLSHTLPQAPSTCWDSLSLWSVWAGCVSSAASTLRAWSAGNPSHSQPLPSWQGHFSPCLHPQSSIPKPGTCCISVAASRASQNVLPTEAPPTCGISLSVSGIISWTFSVCTQEQ